MKNNNPSTIPVPASKARELWNTIPDDTGWKESFRELFGDMADEVCPMPKPWEWIKTTNDAKFAIDGLLHNVSDESRAIFDAITEANKNFHYLQTICLAINGNKPVEGEHYEIIPNPDGELQLVYFDTDTIGPTPRTLWLASYEQAEHCLKWFEGMWKQYYGL